MVYAIVAKVLYGINLFFDIITFIMILYAFMSWFVRPNNAFYQLLARFCQPIVAPFRPIAARLMQSGFMFDVSYILAFFAIRIAQYLVVQVFKWILMLLF